MEAHVKDKDQWVDCQRQQHDYRRSEEPVRKEFLLTIAGGISDSMSHFKLRIADCGLRIEKLQIYPEIRNPQSEISSALVPSVQYLLHFAIRRAQSLTR